MIQQFVLDVRWSTCEHSDLILQVCNAERTTREMQTRWVGPPRVLHQIQYPADPLPNLALHRLESDPFSSVWSECEPAAAAGGLRATLEGLPSWKWRTPLDSELIMACHAEHDV